MPKEVLHVLNCAIPDEIEVPSGRKAAKGILMWLENSWEVPLPYKIENKRVF